MLCENETLFACLLGGAGGALLCDVRHLAVNLAATTPQVSRSLDCCQETERYTTGRCAREGADQTKRRAIRRRHWLTTGGKETTRAQRLAAPDPRVRAPRVSSAPQQVRKTERGDILH